ncbi:2-dehydropantoate 2-reductase N-terminal domain-containing protein, partial [Clostridium botulinum]
MADITFLGAGSFGTALSIMLSKKGYDINIWARNKKVVDDINIKRENIKYIQDIIIPSNVKAFTDLEEAIGNSKVIVIATPSHVVRDISRDIKHLIGEDTIIVSLAKGMEKGTFKRLSEVIKEEHPNNPVVVLSGPSHAEEIALDIPTTVVVTSKDMKYARKIQEMFMTNKFRVYTNEDIIGVEIG